MRKYQYIAAIACVLVGAVGFAGMYAYDQSQKKSQENNTPIVESTQDSQKDLGEEGNSQVAVNDTEGSETEGEPNVDGSQVAEKDPQEGEETGEETPVDNVVKETLHFQPERGLVWPLEGPTLLDYSMDGTIYFPTLQQYQYHPAMVIGGEVNDKVYFVAKGKVTKIETNEVTGCTVTQDLGDGYTAIYGQLKELNFKVGDMVESGQIVGYVSEPTKYYSVEGPCVYFKILKDGVPIDPEELFTE
ncbi:MAG: peptidoglycan DD-metalloendopeptidase family protein [Agathobacter sp.]